MDWFKIPKLSLIALARYIEKQGFASETQFVPLAILGLTGFPIYYIFWHDISTQAYESLSLRLLGFFICLILAVKDYWPQKLRFLLPYYWYFTLFYTLSFFFAFMLFKNDSSNAWLMTTLTGLVLLMLVINWISATVIFIIGIGIAWIAYVYTTEHIIIPVPFFKTLPTYITVLIAGSIFVYRSSKLQQEKIYTLQSLGASIAHELRTPLAAITMAVSGIKRYWSYLIEGYNLANQHGLPVHPLRESQLSKISLTTQNILDEIYYANSIITMLLIKSNEAAISSSKLEDCSIKECVEQTLQRYPFAPGEKDFVHWQNGTDFTFKGDQLFIIHVLFNLLKNAIYYIHVARKGSIYIWLEESKIVNKLYFKDTGTGISAKYMKHLFNKFFTKTHGGTGLGLAFSKMVMQNLGGDIVCRSVEGEYTEFELSFPKIEALL